MKCVQFERLPSAGSLLSRCRGEQCSPVINWPQRKILREHMECSPTHHNMICPAAVGADSISARAIEYSANPHGRTLFAPTPPHITHLIQQQNPVS